MFVLIYPFTSQIFCVSNDIMQIFIYNEKTWDDLLQYNGINFTSRKNGSNLRYWLNRKTLFWKLFLTRIYLIF